MAILRSTQLSAEDSVSSCVPTAPVTKLAPRHSALVRVTHWVTTVCFFALLVTGIEILILYPRFYWVSRAPSWRLRRYNCQFLPQEDWCRPVTVTCCPTRMARAGHGTLKLPEWRCSAICFVAEQAREWGEKKRECEVRLRQETLDNELRIAAHIEEHTSTARSSTPP